MSAPCKTNAHSKESAPCKMEAPDIFKNERGEGISVYSRANLYGRFTADPDKSITVRAVLLGAVARGKTVIKNPLVSGDTLAALECAKTLGASVSVRENEIVITGAEKITDGKTYYCYGSGTTARLLAGMLAGAGVNAEITGDEVLSSRPMNRVVSPLKERGANISCNQNVKGGGLPMIIRPAELAEFEYEMPVDSAQIKSAVILSGVTSGKKTVVTERNFTRNHTEEMLPLFGGNLKVCGKKIVYENSPLKGCEITVPADPSSAAYYIALGILLGEVTVPKVPLNDTRTGFYKILADAGCKIFRGKTEDCGGFAVSDITAKKSLPRYFETEFSSIASVIDELPLLAVVAAFGGGAKIKNAGELRVKECDRLTETARLINLAGGKAEIFGDDLIVYAEKPHKYFEYFSDDHRMVMTAFVLMSAACGGKLYGSEYAAVSFPNFFKNFNNFPCCLFGENVTKSFSGVIHKHNLTEFGKENFFYEMRSVRGEEFEKEIEKPRYKLINATNPFKNALKNAGESAAEIASLSSSANFLFNGKSYSTDGYGLLYALKSCGVEIKNENVLVIGAGGAGRSVCVAFAKYGAHVFLWNRTYEKAVDFCNKAKNNGLNIMPVANEALCGERYYVVIKTTAGDEISGFNYECLKGAFAAADIRYGVPSSFLEAAKNCGVNVISNGKKMLFYQAYIMDEILTGNSPDFARGKQMFSSFAKKEPAFAD